ncbi:ABC transporter permease [Pelagibacterium sp.]|uniref:ABC transporter permease n=1 Tax=Pelagibacterium sp. TaxID=1967288 RepID=UPI003A902A8E
MASATISTRLAGYDTLGRAIQLGFLLVLAILWYVSTEQGMVNPLVLPAPGAVFEELWEIFAEGEVWSPLFTTLGQIAVALAVSSIVGLTVGYLASRTGYTVKVFDPLFSSLYAIPSILFYPLLILFFGIGVQSKIAMGILIAIFPIILATIAGFANVDRAYKVAAQSMGASDRQMFFHVLLPAALPVIASGLRIGTITATGGTLAAEALGSFNGLGHMIVTLSDQFNMAKVFAYVIVAIAMALIITFSAFAVENRINRHA